MQCQGLHFTRLPPTALPMPANAEHGRWEAAHAHQAHLKRSQAEVVHCGERRLDWLAAVCSSTCCAHSRVCGDSCTDLLADVAGGPHQGDFTSFCQSSGAKLNHGRFTLVMARNTCAPLQALEESGSAGQLPVACRCSAQTPAQAILFAGAGGERQNRAGGGSACQAGSPADGGAC